MRIPIHLEDFNIYDVLYNHDQEYVIVAPNIKQMDIKLICGKTSHKFDVFNCPYGHTSVYVCKFNRCWEKITLEIDGNILKNVKVSRYHNLENDMVMSTMVRNEDNYIKQWIEFHRLLGINKFIIYDNSKYTGREPKLSTQKTSDLDELLKDYIEQNIVQLIEWKYPYRLKHPDRNAKHISGQTTHQCHTIHAFRNCKLIGFFDIDEYVNVSWRNWERLDSFFDHILSDRNLSLNEISAFRLNAKEFYNPSGSMEVGYEFMKIFECGDVIKRRREKMFVNPRNVLIFSCHIITKYTKNSKPVLTMDDSQLYYNHYLYLNKPGRGKAKTPTRLHQGPKTTDNSILVMYNRLLPLK